MPIITTLGNPGLRERHWEKISEIIGFPIRPSPDLTLQKVLDMNLDEYLPKFELISEAASKEHSLEKNLERMKIEWADMVFQIVPYRYNNIMAPLPMEWKIEKMSNFTERLGRTSFHLWMKFKFYWTIISSRPKPCWALHSSNLSLTR